MKFATWNVNGFRAVLKKGFEDFFYDTDGNIEGSNITPGWSNSKTFTVKKMTR